jgi:hypothetical protein
MSHDHLDLAKRELEQHGIVPIVTQTKSSLCIEWVTSGRRQRVYASLTPLDVNAVHQVRRDIRRRLRAANVTVWKPFASVQTEHGRREK